MIRNKYGARKVRVGEEVFDSQKEANRYCELRMLERAGKIQHLRRQVPYELIPAQRIDGKVVERAVIYKADFCYYRDGEAITEDVKGFKTPEYKLKKKLMLYVHGIRIKET